MAELVTIPDFYSSIHISPFCANYGCERVLSGSIKFLSESPVTVQEYVKTIQGNVDIITKELKIVSKLSKHFAD